MMNAPALAKNLSAYVRRMFKGADVEVGQPFKAATFALFKDRPPSWNFTIQRRGSKRGEPSLLTTVVYVQMIATGLDVRVDGPDAPLVRDMIAEAPPPWGSLK